MTRVNETWLPRPQLLRTACALAASWLTLVQAEERPVFAEPLSPGSAGDRLGEVDQEIAQMKQDLSVVARGYGNPGILETSSGRLEKRLREGEIHFLLGDYLRASIVLFDIVDREENRSHPRYDDCVYFLAESLRKSQQYSGARRYFEGLLPRVSGDRLKDVVLSLLEIASSTERYEHVDEYVQRLRSAGTLSRPDVDYIQGKMLFQSADGDSSRLEQAYGVFKGVPAGTSVSPQAAYYAGVVLVRLQRYDQAINDFKEALSRAQAAGSSASRLVELSHLALARLHQELGHLDDSVDQYQEIGRRSSDFTQMLFEVAWAHVKAAGQVEDPTKKEEALARALRMAELLMATGPDAKLFPEARILEGNLQIRLGAPETAYDTFQSIIDRYGGARSKLADLIASNPDPRSFFDQIVKDDLSATTNTDFVPPIAIEWAVEAPEMRRAVAVMTDIREAETFQKESEELIALLSDAIKGERRYSMFEGLAAARAKAFGLENRMVLINRRLLDVERRVLEKHLSESELAAIEAAGARRSRLEAEVQALPKDEVEVETRQAEIEDQFTKAQQRAFRQSLEISSMRAQIIAIESWLNQNRDHLGADGLQMMSERLEAVKAEVRALEAEAGALESGTRTAAAAYSTEAGRGRAEQVRSEYSEAMAAEADLLAQYRSKAPSDAQGVASRIDGQRQTLNQMASDLSRLQAELDQQVDARVADIREQIEVERARLAQTRSEYGGLRGETDQSLGPVAKEALNTVTEQFKALVLKADVGIIDVAWARKQGATDEVGRLVREQQLRIRELETEFADVLEEE